MAEDQSYLKTIFGDEALQVEMFPFSGLKYGRYDFRNNHHPLDGITRSDQSIGLTTDDEMMSGHFRDILTLPAYRIMELAAAVESDAKISKIYDAEFYRIVKPGDYLKAIKVNKTVHVKRDERDVAKAKIEF